MPKAASKLTATLSVSGLMVFGTLNSLLAKIVYSVKGEDLRGKPKPFRKPWASTTFMFVAMVFCLPVAYAQEYWQKRQKVKKGEGAEQPLLEGAGSDSEDNNSQETTTKQIFLLLIPTLFDLAATLLMSVGLLYVTASVYQMLRGTEIVFAAIFSITFLHRKLNKFHFIGIGLCLVGVAGVGASSLLGKHDGDAVGDVTPAQALIGMALIVLAEAIQAAQCVMEDYFMSDIGFEPLKVAGFEGVFGTALMFGALLPLVQILPGKEGEGIHEDTKESWHMITHSDYLPLVIGGNMVGMLLYNVAGMFVTDELGAVSRTVLETMRTLFVWLVDLALFYTPLGMGKLGEQWEASSYLQAAGFVVLFGGTLIYSRGDKEEEAAVHTSYAASKRAEGEEEGEAPAAAKLFLRRPHLRGTRHISPASYGMMFIEELRAGARARKTAKRFVEVLKDKRRQRLQQRAEQAVRDGTQM